MSAMVQIDAADQDRREIGGFHFSARWRNARSGDDGEVSDAIIRMRCRARMLSRQMLHDREQARDD